MNRFLRIGDGFDVGWGCKLCIRFHLSQNLHLCRLMFWIIHSLGVGVYGFERWGSLVYSYAKHSNRIPIMINWARRLEHFSQLLLPIDRLLLLLRGV